MFRQSVHTVSSYITYSKYCISCGLECRLSYHRQVVLPKFKLLWSFIQRRDALIGNFQRRHEPCRDIGAFVIMCNYHCPYLNKNTLHVNYIYSNLYFYFIVHTIIHWFCLSMVCPFSVSKHISFANGPLNLFGKPW